MLKHFCVNHNPLRIHLKEYSDNPALCPCNTLKRYIERTSVLRGEVTQLFLSVNKPHLPVSFDGSGLFSMNQVLILPCLRLTAQELPHRLQLKNFGCLWTIS